MKYKIGEKVIFLKKSSKEDGWPLNNYEEYIITESSYSGDRRYPYHHDNDYTPNTYYYGVKSKEKYGSTSTWYEEQDFIGLKEYRKLKLEKINAI